MKPLSQEVDYMSEVGLTIFSFHVHQHTVWTWLNGHM